MIGLLTQVLAAVASGIDGPGKADDMHRQSLDALLSSPEFAHVGNAWDESTRAEVNLVWHRLKGRKDYHEAMKPIKFVYTIHRMARYGRGVEFTQEEMDTRTPFQREHAIARRHGAHLDLCECGCS